MNNWLALGLLALLGVYLIAAGVIAFVSPDLNWKLTRFANPWFGLPEATPEGRSGRRIVSGVFSLIAGVLLLACIVWAVQFTRDDAGTRLLPRWRRLPWTPSPGRPPFGPCRHRSGQRGQRYMGWDGAATRGR